MAVTVQADVRYVPTGHALVQREQNAELTEEEYVRPNWQGAQTGRVRAVHGVWRYVPALHCPP